MCAARSRTIWWARSFPRRNGGRARARRTRRGTARSSVEINQCVLARGVLGILTRTFDFRTGEELSVEQQIKNHVARESFGLGEVKIAPGAKKGDGGGAEGWVEKAEVVLA